MENQQSLCAASSGTPLQCARSGTTEDTKLAIVEGNLPPLGWLHAAARLPGKSLHVGIALWIMGSLQRSQVVTLSNNTIRRFGLDRNAKYRGLEWLEEAGLVSVRRKIGRSPIVTLPFRGPET
jgi:hypothetical protein